MLMAASGGSSGQQADEEQANRKQNHCEIEKRRRDKMNHYITELASVIPAFSNQSSKLDKLTVLRMAVQHVKSLRSSLCSFSSFHLRPSFLSSGNLLKNLILQMASLEVQDNLFMVVTCDRAKVLFVSKSSSDILNQDQEELVGQCLFDILHKDDVAKVKEQITHFNLTPTDRTLVDSKTLQPIRNNQRQLFMQLQNQAHGASGPHTQQPGARRSFFCRMKSGRSWPPQADQNSSNGVAGGSVSASGATCPHAPGPCRGHRLSSPASSLASSLSSSYSTAASAATRKHHKARHETRAPANERPASSSRPAPAPPPPPPEQQQPPISEPEPTIVDDNDCSKATPSAGSNKRSRDGSSSGQKKLEDRLASERQKAQAAEQQQHLTGGAAQAARRRHSKKAREVSRRHHKNRRASAAPTQQDSSNQERGRCKQRNGGNGAEQAGNLQRGLDSQGGSISGDSGTSSGQGGASSSAINRQLRNASSRQAAGNSDDSSRSPSSGGSSSLSPPSSAANCLKKSAARISSASKAPAKSTTKTTTTTKAAECSGVKVDESSQRDGQAQAQARGRRQAAGASASTDYQDQAARAKAASKISEGADERDCGGELVFCSLDKEGATSASGASACHASSLPAAAGGSRKQWRYIVMHCTGYLKPITLRTDEYDDDDDDDDFETGNSSSSGVLEAVAAAGLAEPTDFDFEGGEMSSAATSNKLSRQRHQTSSLSAADFQSAQLQAALRQHSQLSNPTGGPFRTINCLVAVCRRSAMDRDLKPDRPLTFTCRYSMEGKFVFADQRTTVALGYTPQQLIGTSHYAYCHKDSVNTFKECHRQCILKSETVSSDIYQFKRANGQHLWLQTSLKSFRNPWTKFIDYIVANHTTAEGNEPRYNECCVPTKFNRDISATLHASHAAATTDPTTSAATATSRPNDDKEGAKSELNAGAAPSSQTGSAKTSDSSGASPSSSCSPESNVTTTGQSASASPPQSSSPVSTSSSGGSSCTESDVGSSCTEGGTSCSMGGASGSGSGGGGDGGARCGASHKSGSPSSSSVVSSYSMESYNSGASIQGLLNQIDRVKSGAPNHSLEFTHVKKQRSCGHCCACRGSGASNSANRHHRNPERHHHHHHKNSNSNPSSGGSVDSSLARGGSSSNSAASSQSNARKSNNDSGNFSDLQSCLSVSSQNSQSLASASSIAGTPSADAFLRLQNEVSNFVEEAAADCSQQQQQATTATQTTTTQTNDDNDDAPPKVVVKRQAAADLVANQIAERADDDDVSPPRKTAAGKVAAATPLEWISEIEASEAKERQGSSDEEGEVEEDEEDAFYEGRASYAEAPRCQSEAYNQHQRSAAPQFVHPARAQKPIQQVTAAAEGPRMMNVRQLTGSRPLIAASIAIRPLQSCVPYQYSYRPPPLVARAPATAAASASAASASSQPVRAVARPPLAQQMSKQPAPQSSVPTSWQQQQPGTLYHRQQSAAAVEQASTDSNASASNQQQARYMSSMQAQRQHHEMMQMSTQAQNEFVGVQMDEVSYASEPLMQQQQQQQQQQYLSSPQMGGYQMAPQTHQMTSSSHQHHHHPHQHQLQDNMNMTMQSQQQHHHLNQPQQHHHQHQHNHHQQHHQQQQQQQNVGPADQQQQQHQVVPMIWNASNEPATHYQEPMICQQQQQQQVAMMGIDQGDNQLRMCQQQQGLMTLDGGCCQQCANHKCCMEMGQQQQSGEPYPPHQNHHHHQQQQQQHNVNNHHQGHQNAQNTTTMGHHHNTGDLNSTMHLSSLAVDDLDENELLECLAACDPEARLYNIQNNAYNTQQYNL